MKLIKMSWNTPYHNFATEEYLLTKAPEDDYLFFYIHKPSIIVGRFQNTIEEINKDFVDKNDIIVARRLSGGGAVYHDAGNLNFSMVQKSSKVNLNNFKLFARPVIDALKSLDIDAELSGRNDILVDNKKISGNAQAYKNGRMLHHGTLLFDADMSNLTKALKVKDIKVKSKGIKSVRSRVGNISDYLDKEIDIYEFKNYLTSYLGSDIEEYILSDKELDEINKIAENLSTWEWNWGKSPKFEIEKLTKFDCGLIEARLNVSSGRIESIKIYGDFFTAESLEKLETHLKGTRYERDSLIEKLKDIDVGAYFKGLDEIDLTEFLVG